MFNADWPMRLENRGASQSAVKTGSAFHHHEPKSHVASLRTIALTACVVLMAGASAHVSAQTRAVVNEKAKVLASDGAAGDKFGDAVAVSGSTFVVGAPFAFGNFTSAGSAYVYVQNPAGAATQQAKLKAADGFTNDGFGISAAVNADTAVVGAFTDDVGAVLAVGSAYVYVRNANNIWFQQAKLAPFDGAGFDIFGSSVAISGDTAVIGSPKDDDTVANSGSAYVYTRSPAGVWIFQTKLHASDPASGDRFGQSVSIDGDSVVVGSFSSSIGVLAGAAYVFNRNLAGVWTQQAKLLAADGAANDFFGNTVSISVDTVIVGANRHDDVAADSGAAYVYTRTAAGVWSQQTKLLAFDAAASDWFGWSVSVSGDKAVVAARLDDDNGADSGSAYVFTRDAAGVWSLKSKLLASDGAAGDWLGRAAAIDGNKVIVGASQDDDNGVDSGSAYLYTLGCQEDLDGDGAVGASDLAALIGFWGQTGVAADFDGSGLVGSSDLAQLLGLWGPCL